MGNSRDRRPGTSRKRVAWTATIAAAAVLATGGLAFSALAHSRQPAASSPEYTPTVVVEVPSTDPLTSLTLPGPGAKVVMIGDSWAGGYAATPSKNGFMWLTGDHFGWNYELYAMPGSGYLNDGQYQEGTYLDRMSGAPVMPDAQLVLIQGSVNDGGENLDSLTASAIALIEDAKARYPEAQIALIGPAPLAFPTSDRTRTMDFNLWRAAGAEQTAYISIVDDGWLTADNFASYIDASKANHPTTVGHAYLAERLIASLDALGGSATG